MPDLAASMPSDSPTEAPKYQTLVDRFEQRANRLHRQATFLLYIIIAVLILGAVGFLLANNIASFTLGSQTTQDKYVLSTTALKNNSEQQDMIRKQISDVTASVEKPFNDKINEALANLGRFEKSLLEKCTDITYENHLPADIIGGTRVEPMRQIITPLSELLPAQNRIDEFSFSTPDLIVYFKNHDSGVKCHEVFNIERSTTVTYVVEILDIIGHKRIAVMQAVNSKQDELQPLQNKLEQLIKESSTLSALSNALQSQAIEERTLGSSPKKSQNIEADGKIDWTTIIQNNVTRIGALAITFFLVSIIVPQYRYNIRLENFYNARADSLRMSSSVDFNSPDDLGKIVNIMSPNIDFGKAPAMPWEQLIEVVKSVKS
jgi:hypothetical protein